MVGRDLHFAKNQNTTTQENQWKGRTNNFYLAIFLDFQKWLGVIFILLKIPTQPHKKISEKAVEIIFT